MFNQDDQIDEHKAYESDDSDLNEFDENPTFHELFSHLECKGKPKTPQNNGQTNRRFLKKKISLQSLEIRSSSSSRYQPDEDNESNETEQRFDKNKNHSSRSQLTNAPSNLFDLYKSRNSSITCHKDVDNSPAKSSDSFDALPDRYGGKYDSSSDSEVDSDEGEGRDYDEYMKNVFPGDSVDTNVNDFVCAPNIGSPEMNMSSEDKNKNMKKKNSNKKKDSKKRKESIPQNENDAFRKIFNILNGGLHLNPCQEPENFSGNPANADSSSSWTLGTEHLVFHTQPVQSASPETTQKKWLQTIMDRGVDDDEVEIEDSSTQWSNVSISIAEPKKLPFFKIPVADLCNSLDTNIDSGMQIDMIKLLESNPENQQQQDDVIIDLENLTAVPVIRSTQILGVRKSQLIPGDIVLLNKGDIIPADIRIVQSYNLILSNDRTSEDAIPEAAFSGGFVLAGTMKGIVVKTGLKTKSGKMAKRTQMPLSKNLLDLRISLYKNNILSLDPSRVGYMKKKFDEQKIEHKAAPKPTFCATFSYDYLQKIKSQFKTAHSLIFNFIDHYYAKLTADPLQIICDFTIPHYYSEIIEICKIHPNSILSFPKDEYEAFLEYAETATFFHQGDFVDNWSVHEPTMSILEEVNFRTTSAVNHVIIIDCTPGIMKAIIEENIFSFGVVYMGGFLIEEKPLIDLCTLSICIGRNSTCVARSDMTCKGSQLEALFGANKFIQWLYGYSAPFIWPPQKEFLLS